MKNWFQRLRRGRTHLSAGVRGDGTDARERLFCSQPFTRFEVLGGGQRGEVYFCCQSWLPKPIGNLQRQSLKDIWNGGTAQKIRRSVLDGSFRYCDADVCPYLQRIDGPVQRVKDLKDEQLLELIRDNSTEVPFGPRDIICCFDQSCNLSCPSCRRGIIMETAHADAILNIQEILEKDALREARLLYITGSGDPFGSPFFRRWLQTMERAKMPKLERLHLHTNGLLWTDKIWASIPEDTRALVKAATISIDAATPETYAVNRRGGTFDTLQRRLAFISSLRRDGPLEFLEIHMTVQANNYEEMPAFVELGRRYNCDRVTFHKLLDWGTYSKSDYVARAVHVPTHPEHAAFLQVLHSPALADTIVYLSNFSDLQRSRAQQEAKATEHVRA